METMSMVLDSLALSEVRGSCRSGRVGADLKSRAAKGAQSVSSTERHEIDFGQCQMTEREISESWLVHAWR